MCIFLCLGDTGLGLSMSCQILTEGIVKFYFLKCNDGIRDGCIILSETYVGQIQLLLSCKSIKLICTECSGDLSCTVRAEVEKDHGIFVLNGCYRLAVFHYNTRFYELVMYFFFVRVCHCAHRALCRNAFAFGQCLISQLYTIPAVITVHCIIAAHNGSNLTNADLFHLIT